MSRPAGGANPANDGKRCDRPASENAAIAETGLRRPPRRWHDRRVIEVKTNRAKTGASTAARLGSASQTGASTAARLGSASQATGRRGAGAEAKGRREAKEQAPQRPQLRGLLLSPPHALRARPRRTLLDLPAGHGARAGPAAPAGAAAARHLARRPRAVKAPEPSRIQADAADRTARLSASPPLFRAGSSTSSRGSIPPCPGVHLHPGDRGAGRARCPRRQTAPARSSAGRRRPVHLDPVRVLAAPQGLSLGPRPPDRPPPPLHHPRRPSRPSRTTGCGW